MAAIRIYYHLSFLNHWEKVTRYIFDKTRDSGLLDACESINIGALGNAEHLPRLKEIMASYSDKIVLRGHSSDLGLWELFSIKFLKEDAHTYQDKFYALYYHSKSVTHPPEGNDEGKTPDSHREEFFWMSYMINECVTRWKTCYAALDLPEYGYEVAGARYIPKRHSASVYAHPSGNVWWTNSEYVRTLPKIVDYMENDDHKQIEDMQIALDEFKKNATVKAQGNMFGAEEYINQNQPLTYIACNAFTVGFSHVNTFEEVVRAGYPLEKYRTNP